MATQERYPDPDANSNASTDEQTRHSGKGGFEKPVREFDNTPLDKAPLDYDPRTSEEELHTGHLPQDLQLKPERNVKTWQKATAAGVIVLSAVGAGFGISRLTAGEEGKPTTEPSVGASAVPGNPEVSVAIPTPEQELRESLSYAISSHYFIDPSFYEQFEGIDNPGGYGDIRPYVDEAELHETIQDLLNNQTFSYETSNEDGILATYKQSAPGGFGEVQTEVDIIREQSTFGKENQAAYPNYPVSSRVLESIDSIIPDLTDPNTVSVTFTSLRTIYGNYMPENEVPVVAFPAREQWEWKLSLDEVAGWSDGGTRLTWVIEGAYSDSITPLEN